MTGPDRSPAAQARRTALLLFWGMALVLTAGQFTVERPLYDRLFLNWIPAFLGCGLLLSVLPRRSPAGSAGSAADFCCWERWAAAQARSCILPPERSLRRWYVWDC